METRPSPQISLADGLSREYLLYHRICPKSYTEDGTLRVVAADEALLEGIDDLRFAYACEVVVESASYEEVERLIERLSTRAERSIEIARMDAADDDLMADVRDLATQPPVIRYVNLVLREAYDAEASDIHLEATKEGLSARFRMDGVLAPAPEPPPGLHQAVVSRIKLLAELDIAERRRPQDGRIRVRLAERELDVRVSTVPTMFGESVVLRLLDRGGRPVSLDELGMAPDILAAMVALARKPHGMIIATGPTGSGKTTTLYAALGRRDTAAEKIITVEDPVEYELSGITQMPVHRRAGVTFGSALRSILRQDPDIIMIGEMRDGETAEIAVQAAMTGHLVFSTLHTNDATGALPRLLDLGVPNYLVAATIEAILAQRLVRLNCRDCLVEYAPESDDIRRLRCERPGGAVRFLKGAGCTACRGTGYRGRIGVFELLILDRELRSGISAGVSREQLRKVALEGGMRTLRADGWQKVMAGLTTTEEVLRVVQE